MVKAGDSIPSVELSETRPDNAVKLSEKLASGKGLIIGVPAAFSPTCSDSHIPAYVSSPKIKDAGNVYVVSVNDAFVMNAWGKQLDADGKSGIHFVGDPTAEFSKALDLTFDAPALGGVRGSRYALVTEDGKIKSVHVEESIRNVDLSSVEKVLG